MKKFLVAFATVATLAMAGLASTEASARGGHGGHGMRGGHGHHFHGGHFGARWGHRGWRRGGVAVVGFAGGYGVAASCYRRVWTPYGFVIRNVCEID